MDLSHIQDLVSKIVDSEVNKTIIVSKLDRKRSTILWNLIFNEYSTPVSLIKTQFSRTLYREMKCESGEVLPLKEGDILPPVHCGP